MVQSIDDTGNRPLSPFCRRYCRRNFFAAANAVIPEHRIRMSQRDGWLSSPVLAALDFVSEFLFEPAGVCVRAGVVVLPGTVVFGAAVTVGEGDTVGLTVEEGDAVGDAVAVGEGDTVGDVVAVGVGDTVPDGSASAIVNSVCALPSSNCAAIVCFPTDNVSG